MGVVGLAVVLLMIFGAVKLAGTASTETVYTYSFVDKPLGVSLRKTTEPNSRANVEVSAVKRQHTNIEVGDLVKAINGQDVTKFKLQDIFAIFKTVKVPVDITFIKK